MKGLGLAVPREIPVSPHALTASIEDLPGNTARVTIGQITSIYANAAKARDWLERQAARGVIRLVPAQPEAVSC